MSEMEKKTTCDKAEKYECPYVQRCRGEWYHITNDSFSSLTDPKYLWYVAKTQLTRTSKIWFKQDSEGKNILYICQPFTKYQTFHESEKNGLIFRIKKEFLIQVNDLTTKLRNEIKNIESKHKKWK